MLWLHIKSDITFTWLYMFGNKNGQVYNEDFQKINLFHSEM